MVAEFCLLGTLLLGGEDPSTLIHELSDDAIWVRERAASELFRRGRELRGFLIEALASASELEVRERLEGVLRRMDVDDRIRDFGGGRRVAGFGASLRSDRFFGSGPFRLQLEIMNLGATDRELPRIAIWEQDFPDQEWRRSGAQARIQAKKLLASPGLRRTTWRRGDGAAAAPQLLRPGEGARYDVVLDAASFPAGDYDVSIEYFARDWIPGALESLRSNSVRLMIRK
jgi:hypothetical protein